jgi:ParB-like chromosome segregation protein Spo0J
MSSHAAPLVQGVDVPIVRLVPRHDRSVNKTQLKRIEASLRSVGLIEPLIVYPDGENYEILDGCLRYRILLEMGVESVPCLVNPKRDGFTANRMVNQLSASQEMRMLRKSLEELDEKTIASALGFASIGHRLNKGLIQKLDPLVAKAFNANKITLQVAKELAHVKNDRQVEILKLMESCNDYSVTFAKGLVLKTPVSKRAKTSGRTSPWSRGEEKKTDLIRKLQEAELQQDFYSGLYRQYAANLLKLVIYCRALLGNPQVAAYLKEHHPEVLDNLLQIINATEQ